MTQQENSPRRHPEQPPQFLPQITDDTRDNLFYTLGIKPKEEETRNDRNQLAQASTSMAEDVMSDLAAVNPHFVQTIANVLRTATNVDRGMMNTETIGMATVLRAYHVNGNYDLIDRMRMLTPQHVTEAQMQLEQLLQGANAPTIIERALQAPRIPVEQMNLNMIVGRVGDAWGTGFSSDVKRGAAVMYEVLRQQWPILYPGEGTPSLPEQPTG